MERTARPQVIQTLNEMLEEERAAVEAVIGLTAMSTDPNERDQLQRIGGNEVWACSGLRTAIESLGGVTSRHISDFATYVLSLEYFPERLRTFGRHQRLIMERISTLLNHRKLEDETKAFLEQMFAQHAKDIVWCEQRAQTFEASRLPTEAQRNAPQPPLAPLPPLNPPPTAPVIASPPATVAPPPIVEPSSEERPRRTVRRRTPPADPSTNGNAS